MEPSAPTVTLAGGAHMPLIGLGTWPMDDEEAAEAVTTAIAGGYRMIDTAENYGNEVGVGEGLRRSGLPRERLFVTTKFNRKWHSVEGAAQACHHALDRLGLDYLDLFLIHWPDPDQGQYLEAYEGLVALRDQGLVRAIGTSNFEAHHLQELLDAGFVPEVNQIQLDPHTPRPDELALHAQHGIHTESWRPFGQAGVILTDPVVLELAEQLGRTPHQIALRWQVQQGFSTCPKSADPARQRSNLDVFGFELSPSDMARLTQDRSHPDQLDADTFGH